MMQFRVTLHLPARLGLASAIVVVASCGAPLDEVVDEAPLRIGIYAEVLSVDPHRKDEFLTRSVLMNVYESLVGFDASSRIVPLLAESWENPDDLTWRFNLRRNVVFHDGTPLNADDVITSLHRSKDLDLEVAYALVAMDRVLRLDDHTVEIVTDRPYPILLHKLASLPIVPADSPATIVQPVGTGPYESISMDLAQSIRLRSFDRYWGGAPPVRLVEYQVVPDASTRIAKLEESELDFILEVPPGEVARLNALADIAVVRTEGTAVEYLHLDPAVPPFDDPRVREAIDLGLDRRQILDRVLYGQGLPASQLLVSGTFGYVPDLGASDHDPIRSRGLLSEVRGGAELRARLAFRSGRLAMGQEIARQLQAVGLEIDLEPMDWSELFPALQRNEVPFYLGAFLAPSADASDLFDGKVHSPNPEAGYGQTNFIGYADPELDRLIEASAVTLDLRSRNAILEQAMRRLREARVLIPISSAFNIVAGRSDVVWTQRADSRVLGSDFRRP